MINFTKITYLSLKRNELRFHIKQEFFNQQNYLSRKHCFKGHVNMTCSNRKMWNVPQAQRAPRETYQINNDCIHFQRLSLKNITYACPTFPSVCYIVRSKILKLYKNINDSSHNSLPFSLTITKGDHVRCSYIRDRNSIEEQIFSRSMFIIRL